MKEFGKACSKWMFPLVMIGIEGFIKDVCSKLASDEPGANLQDEVTFHIMYKGLQLCLANSFGVATSC